MTVSGSRIGEIRIKARGDEMKEDAWDTLGGLALGIAVWVMIIAGLKLMVWIWTL